MSTFIEAKTKKEAEKKEPSAVVIKKVEGGYMGFSSANEYDTWRKQK